MNKIFHYHFYGFFLPFHYALVFLDVSYDEFNASFYKVYCIGRRMFCIPKYKSFSTSLIYTCILVEIHIFRYIFTPTLFRYIFNIYLPFLTFFIWCMIFFIMFFTCSLYFLFLIESKLS